MLNYLKEKAKATFPTKKGEKSRMEELEPLPVAIPEAISPVIEGEQSTTLAELFEKGKLEDGQNASEKALEGKSTSPITEFIGTENHNCNVEDGDMGRENEIENEEYACDKNVEIEDDGDVGDKDLGGEIEHSSTFGENSLDESLGMVSADASVDDEVSESITVEDEQNTNEIDSIADKGWGTSVNMRMLTKDGEPASRERKGTGSPNEVDDDVVFVSETVNPNAPIMRTRTRLSVGVHFIPVELVLNTMEEVVVKRSCTTKRTGKRKVVLGKQPESSKRTKRMLFDDDLEEDMAPEVSEGARWRLICGRNVLPERYLSEATSNNKTYKKVLLEAGVMCIVTDIGLHLSRLVREFICSITEDISDPTSPMYNKVQLRGHVFIFSPTLINRQYGLENKGTTGATLKLGEIMGELT